MNRGAIYEQVYLQSRPEEDLDACAKDLRNALINAYQKSLEIMDYARTQLRDGRAASRFFEALWDPQKAKDKLNELQEAETSLQETVTACNVKKQHLQNEKSLRLLKRLEKPLRYIDEKVSKLLTEMGDHELFRTLDFICKIHIGNQHRAMTLDKTKGTGEWLSQRKEFREWEDSSSSNILWLTGKVGAGKSVLTSGIIDRYLVNQNNQGDINEADSNVDEGFAFFYYSKNNKDVTDDPVTNVLRSFLRQLAQVPHYANGIFDDLASLCRKMEKSQQAFTPDLCRDKILRLVNALPRTILVLDSLDELEPQHMQEIISFFVNLVNTSERPVKIFVSSRFTTDIYNEVNKANNKPMRMDIAAKNQGDIKRFVLERTMRIDCRWRNEEVRGEVVEKISRDANGMFRWAFMQIDQLIKYHSPEDVKERLGRLPEGLTAAYDELYAKPGSHDEIYLQRAVKWVMHAYVPLSTEELLAAVQLGLADEHDDLVSLTKSQAAAYYKSRDGAEMLINAGATVDLRLDGEYDTPLMAAVHSGSLDIAKLLIKHGADVNIKPEPSQYGGVLGAAFCGRRAVELIPYLIEEAGADPNRIIEDLRERNPQGDLGLGPEAISEWLFFKNYLNPEEVKGLDYNASPNALGPLIRTARERFARR
ncbi:hypothetical protein LY78DRAFT_678825 [Colletotrichum sublineola]|nr:hypothetical protein LY78DRAFT_678825 [Colletotrichum sublineola]